MLNNQKKCTKCQTTKELSEFNNDKVFKDGLNSVCRKCSNIIIRLHNSTKIGLIRKIYQNQKVREKRSDRFSITYTIEELQEWLSNDWLFDLLRINWINCGFLKDMRPSIDRIDDNKGYSFDNIQVMTWKENKTKSEIDMRSGKLTHGNNPQKAVLQLNKSNQITKEYVSINEAGRQTGIDFKCISACCVGRTKTAGGYKWEHKKG